MQEKSTSLPGGKLAKHSSYSAHCSVCKRLGLPECDEFLAVPYDDDFGVVRCIFCNHEKEKHATDRRISALAAHKAFNALSSSADSALIQRAAERRPSQLALDLQRVRSSDTTKPVPGFRRLMSQPDVQAALKRKAELMQSQPTDSDLLPVKKKQSMTGKSYKRFRLGKKIKAKPVAPEPEKDKPRKRARQASAFTVVRRKQETPTVDRHRSEATSRPLLGSSTLSARTSSSTLTHSEMSHRRTDSHEQQLRDRIRSLQRSLAQAEAEVQDAKAAMDQLRSPLRTLSIGAPSQAQFSHAIRTSRTLAAAMADEEDEEAADEARYAPSSSSVVHTKLAAELGRTKGGEQAESREGFGGGDAESHAELLKGIMLRRYAALEQGTQEQEVPDLRSVLRELLELQGRFCSSLSAMLTPDGADDLSFAPCDVGDLLAPYALVLSAEKDAQKATAKLVAKLADGEGEGKKKKLKTKKLQSGLKRILAALDSQVEVYVEFARKYPLLHARAFRPPHYASLASRVQQRSGVEQHKDVAAAVAEELVGPFQHVLNLVQVLARLTLAIETDGVTDVLHHALETLAGLQETKKLMHVILCTRERLADEAEVQRRVLPPSARGKSLSLLWTGSVRLFTHLQHLKYLPGTFTVFSGLFSLNVQGKAETLLIKPYQVLGVITDVLSLMSEASRALAASSPSIELLMSSILVLVTLDGPLMICLEGAACKHMLAWHIMEEVSSALDIHRSDLSPSDWEAVFGDGVNESKQSFQRLWDSLIH